MTSSFFSVSMALRALGTPALVPASLAGLADDYAFDDVRPTNHEPHEAPEIAGLD